MYFNRKKTLLTIIVLFIIIYFNPLDCFAHMNITKNKIDDETIEVPIQCDKDIKKVKLPNGNIITQSDINYVLRGNGSYTFVGYCEDGNIVEETINVSKLRANYLLTPTPNVKLELYSNDVLSGNSKMRFRNESNGTWSSLEPYQTTKLWSLKNQEGIRTVQVQYQDVAENLSDVVDDKIILDMSGPTVTLFNIENNRSAINRTNVTLYVNAVDNYSTVPTMQIANRKTNGTVGQYQSMNYNTQVQWNLSSGGANTLDGTKTVYLRTVDGLGNIGPVVSDTILLDRTLPDGSITIEDGIDMVPSPNVTLNFNFFDPISNGEPGSGIKRVSIYEGSDVYHFPQVPTTNSINWVLNTDTETTFVTLEVEDFAGNIFRTESQTVRIHSLKVEDFEITNVINPLSYPDGFQGPLSWESNQLAQPVEVLSGGDIHFKLKYFIDSSYLLNQYYDLEWRYIVEIKKTNGSTNNTIYASTYTSEWKLLDNDSKSNLTINEVYKIPFEAPTDSNVSIRVELKASAISPGGFNIVQEAFFPDRNGLACIGKVVGNINQAIKFNEIR